MLNSSKDDNYLKSRQTLISHLYRRTGDINIGHYREWALSELQNYLHFDAAVWSTGHLSTRTFHTHTCLGLPKHFPDLLIEHIPINPITKRLFHQAGCAVDMREVIDDEHFYQSEIYQKAFEPFAIKRVLSSIHICSRTGIYTLLSVYRHDQDTPFLEKEKIAYQAVLFHLIDAASHACLLSLKSDDDPASYYAICDSQGVYHEAESGFLDLLAANVNDTEYQRYPFNLTEKERYLANALIQVEALGDLFRLKIRELNPLDNLTDREKQVVEGVTQGLSFKQIAKALQLSPSTVSNHLYRIYQKLDISNRAELADLLKAPN